MKLSTINKTPFGAVVLAWCESDGPLIARIMISSTTRSSKQQASALYPGARRASCREIDRVASRIAAFLAGTDVPFSLDLLALDRCGTFRESVLRATHTIPRGYMATYGGLASHMGCPGGARAVGNAMAANPFPLIVPCHRVIRADLTLGLYGGGVDMKRGLLAQEGVIPDSCGKVSPRQVVFRS